MYSNPDDIRFLQRQLAAQEKHALLTNSILNIAGRQHPRVNGKPLKLGLHAFTVLLLLAAKAIESPGDYFSTEDVVREIEKRRRLLGALNLSWESPTPADVHSAVSALRRALGKKGLNRDLVESAHGRGYRLSVPAMNILADATAAKNLALLSLGHPVPGNGNDPEGTGASGLQR